MTSMISEVLMNSQYLACANIVKIPSLKKIETNFLGVKVFSIVWYLPQQQLNQLIKLVKIRSYYRVILLCQDKILK
jgi:hypothetical protein